MFNQKDNSSKWYNISGGGIHSLYLKQVYLEQTNVRIYDKQNAFLCVASFKGFCINCTNHHVFRSTDMGFYGEPTQYDYCASKIVDSVGKEVRLCKNTCRNLVTLLALLRFEGDTMNSFVPREPFR